MRRLLPMLASISERTQRKLFPILAVIAGSFLVASLVAGLFDSGEVRRRFKLEGFGMSLFAHGLAGQYFVWTGDRIKAKAEELGLPDWVGTQAEKNLWKAAIHAWAGIALFILVMWANYQGPVSGAWFDGLLAFNLAFQVGAFVGEYVIMSAQARLLRDVEEWAKKPDALQF